MESPIIKTFVKGLLNVTLEMPLYCTTMDFITPYIPQLSLDDSEIFFKALYEWAEECLNIISTTDALTTGSLDLDDLLVLVRVISFVGFSSSPPRIKKWCETLYGKVQFVLTVHCVYRYCSNVLEPIISGSRKSLTKQNKDLPRLLDAMGSALRGWMDYCQAEFQV
jgi:hypothetical protein